MWKCPFVFYNWHRASETTGDIVPLTSSILFHAGTVRRPPSTSWASFEMANQLTPRIGMCLQNSTWSILSFLKHTHSVTRSRAWDLCVIKCFTHAPLDYDAWEFIGRPKSRISILSAPLQKQQKEKTIFSAKQIKFFLSLARSLVRSGVILWTRTFFYLFVRSFVRFFFVSFFRRVTLKKPLNDCLTCVYVAQKKRC